MGISLKDYLEHVKVKGRLKTIRNEVLRELEVTKYLIENDGKFTVLFENIKDHTVRAVGNLITSKHDILDILDVSSDVEAYRKVLHAMEEPLKFKGSSIESTHEKVEINNLTEILPIAKYYPKDGGYYITSSIVLAGDGDGNYNASIHRLMLINGRRFAIRIVPRHLYKMFMKFKSVGKDLPVVVLVGVHPAILLSASLSPPYGVYEMFIANKLLHNNIKGDLLTSLDIPTPLASEVIMMGRIRHDLQVNEGPFVDITGTYDTVRLQPVLEIDELWISEDPIFHYILPSGVEHKLLMGFPKEISIWDAVRKVVPDVVKVNLTMGGCGWLHAVISIRKTHEGDGKNAILAAFSAHPSLKHVIVVDDDIDANNIEEVEWAIATRFRADRDLVVISNVRGSSLDPTSQDGLTAKMGLDATKPLTNSEKFEKAKL